jgi:hypothetical protein
MSTWWGDNRAINNMVGDSRATALWCDRSATAPLTIWWGDNRAINNIVGDSSASVLWGDSSDTINMVG